jgi:hypothetical protein
MSSGVTQAAYPVWVALAILCAAVSGRMLVAAEREGLASQAWLAALCFGISKQFQKECSRKFVKNVSKNTAFRLRTAPSSPCR